MNTFLWIFYQNLTKKQFNGLADFILKQCPLLFRVLYIEEYMEISDLEDCYSSEVSACLPEEKTVSIGY